MTVRNFTDARHPHVVPNQHQPRGYQNARAQIEEGCSLRSNACVALV